MITQPFRLCSGGIAIGLLVLGVGTPASGQMQLENGLEMRLLPGFTHQRVRGEHGPSGKFTKKGGLEIQYFMARIGRSDVPTSGDFRNAAQRVPESDRLWLKEQSAAGRQVHVAYTKNRVLIVSSVSDKEGVNFSAVTESPGDVADVLLMVLTLTEQKPKQSK